MSAFCCAARREDRFEPRAFNEDEMRVRLSLSGAMWNWFVVSEMSCEGALVDVGRRWDGHGVGRSYCYWVFVEKNHYRDLMLLEF